jgi:hypothetical protein
MNADRLARSRQTLAVCPPDIASRWMIFQANSEAAATDRRPFAGVRRPCALSATVDALLRPVPSPAAEPAKSVAIDADIERATATFSGGRCGVRSPLAGSGDQKICSERGMAIIVTVRAVSLETDGVHAARTEVAAKATPRSTSAHEPVSTAADVVRAIVATDMPIAAMAMRATLPTPVTAHAWSAGDVVVITSRCRQYPTFA